MALTDNSTPPASGSVSLEEELAYYKAQYESLEAELQEFQASSRELEAELEKDIEASEKRERQLQEKLEGLRFEVDEWKAKHKQAKGEANTAQNTLQKEITTLREANRGLQLRLRDIEVANDDFERQARNTTSSLEDLESKYNVSIERGVMMEEEIKIGEQERESLRIEAQRLKDELSDLRIEAEITQEKLRLAESTIERFHSRRPHLPAVEGLRPRSPFSEESLAATALSSPTTSVTPSALKSDESTISEATSPPSPPLSETGGTVRKKIPITPAPARKMSLAPDANTTPRPGYYTARQPRHSRGPSLAASTTSRHSTVSGTVRRPPPSIRTNGTSQDGGAVNRSTSQHHIRNMIGKAEELKTRIQNARSRLPAPTSTPPRASPRSGSAMGHHIPATVTVRSSRKRPSGSTASSMINGESERGTSSRLSTSHVSRLSFGVPSSTADRAAGTGTSRPSSRASVTSTGNPHTQFARPSGRSSMSGARTPLGHYAGPTGELRRPRSSMSGTFHSQSMSLSGAANDLMEGDEGDVLTPAARRTTLGREGLTSIPTPSGLPRRQSGGISVVGGGAAGARRTSLGYGSISISREHSGSGAESAGEMAPPPARRKLSGVGETF